MRNPSSLPHGGRGSEMLSNMDHEFVRVQFKARLERIVFPDGNQITYFYDKWGRVISVRDVLGRRVNFSYVDGQGETSKRIYAIECFESSTGERRRVELFYGNNYGKYSETEMLVGVRQVALYDHGGHTQNTREWAIDYDITRTMPSGRQKLRPAHKEILRVDAIRIAAPEDVRTSGGVSYFEARFKDFLSVKDWRVDEVLLSGDRNGYGVLQKTDYHYVFGNDVHGGGPGNYYTDSHVFSAAKVSDPRGNMVEHVFDDQGNELRQVVYRDLPGDELITNYQYIIDPDNPPPLGMAYAFHLLYKVTDPKGNYEEYYYQYDAYVDAFTPPHQADRFQFGNLLRKTSYDAVGKAIAKETYTYEPFFNQVLTHVGSRGYEPGADPADYTTSNSYDFMELPAGVLDNWLAPWYIDRTGFSGWQGADLNGDSNIGPNFGSLIRTGFPDVTVGIAAEQGDQSASVLYRYNEYGAVAICSMVRFPIDYFVYRRFKGFEFFKHHRV